MPVPKQRKAAVDAPFCLTHNVRHKINKAMCRVEVNRSANSEIHKCERHGEHCRLHWNTCKDRRRETVQSAAVDAAIEALAKDTDQLLAEAQSRRELGIERLMKRDGIEREEAVLLVDAEDKPDTMETLLITGASIDYLWKAYRRVGIRSAKELGFPGLAAELQTIDAAHPRKIRDEETLDLVRDEPRPVTLEDLGLELVDEREVVEGVVLDPVTHFTPSLQIRKRKRPRPNPYAPRVINPTFDDLDREWF